MNTFPLKIVTAEGMIYDGETRQLTIRTTEGDMTILARHINFVSALGAGCAILTDAAGNRRFAACIGGMISVQAGDVTVIPASFAWAASMEEARSQVRNHVESHK